MECYICCGTENVLSDICDCTDRHIHLKCLQKYNHEKCSVCCATYKNCVHIPTYKMTTLGVEFSFLLMICCISGVSSIFNILIFINVSHHIMFLISAISTGAMCLVLLLYGAICIKSQTFVQKTLKLCFSARPNMPATL